ncbi:MAG TPA: DUF4191 domain-containing protein [Jiangellaceae bacterium]|nr:DUF4191 domain-containing protein [Jiangellaceae bacterium]
MARKDEQQDAAQKKGRFAQLKQTYTMAKRSDPHIGLISLSVVLGVLALGVVVGLLLQPWWMWLIVTLPIALLSGAVIFGRRAEKAAYSQIEGQPGAAAAALGTLRKGWDITPMVGANRYQDVVHRAVGRPGIVLVGEGTSSTRVANLLTQEKRRHARVAPEVPVVDIIVGAEEGEVPLPKLSKYVSKLPRNIRPAEVTELRQRLRALGTQPIGMPKGPLPKGAKIPRGGLPR